MTTPYVTWSACIMEYFMVYGRRAETVWLVSDTLGTLNGEFGLNCEA